MGSVLVLVVLVGAVVLTVARQLVTDAHPAVLAASFAPFAVAAYAVAILGLGLLLRGARRRVLVVVGLVVAATGLATHVAWLAPDFTGGGVGAEPDLTVLTLNVQMGGADLDEVVELVREQAPDLAVLTEVTPQALRELQRRGVGAPGSALPHLGGRPLPGPLGTVVLSSWPLTGETALRLGNRGYQMTVGAPEPFVLSAVHPDYPLLSTEPWRGDLARVAEAARSVEGPHLVVGDFNATVDHAAFREVLDTGLTDAARQAGSGWQPTWPTPGERGVPWLSLPVSLLRLDHVLLSDDFVALETSTHRVAATDHLGLVAQLRR